MRDCVFLESPYSGDIDRNLRYLKLCEYDCWNRYEFPCSSHSNMTQHVIKKNFYVDDYNPQYKIFGREEAINGSHCLRVLCSKTIFYIDLGWSDGMKNALKYCEENKLKYEIRKIKYVNILSLGAPLIKYELIDAIVKNKDYKHLLI